MTTYVCMYDSKYHYGKIYVHNIEQKLCGDYILIKFFFECIIYIQKNVKKKRQEPVSLKADKQLNAF